MDDFISSQISWGILGVILLVASIVWVVLCVKGKIPEPWSKWTLLVAGVFGTFGAWLLWHVFTKRREAPPADPIVVEKKGPTEKEVELLDEKSKKLDQKIKETKKKLQELEDVKNDNSDPADSIDSADLNSDFGKRVREAREKLRRNRE